MMLNDRQLLPCPMQPPAIRGTRTIKTVVRYMTSTGISTTATNSQIANFLVIGGGSTTQYKVCNYIRIKWVRIWGGPPSSLAPATIAFQWSGTVAGSLGPNQQFTDTSMGASYISHMKIKPPVNSSAAQWVATGNGAAPGTNVVFNYVLPPSAVLDICLDCSINDDTTASSITTTNTGTLGVLYALALDHGTSDVMAVQGSNPNLT